MQTIQTKENTIQIVMPCPHYAIIILDSLRLSITNVLDCTRQLDHQ